MTAVTVEPALETDGDLLCLIGCAGDSEDDLELAHDALKELYRRYYRYVFKVLNNFSNDYGTIQFDPAAFATAVFHKVSKVAHQFIDKSGGDQDLSSKQVKSWLGMIASNLARDAIRKINAQNRVHKTVELKDHDVPVVEYEDTTETSSAALTALREEFSGLKDEDKDVLKTYLLLGTLTDSGHQLSTEDREALELRTGYTRSNIRQRWRRLNLRFEALLEPLM